MVNDIGKIFVVPQNNDEAAELLCDANSKTIANVEAGGGTFVVTTAGQTQGKVLVTINGSSIFSGKNFTRNYTVDAQVSLTSSTYFATTSGYFFNTDSLVTKFNEVPTRIDVIN
ncbi:hypothetical protein FACS1894166_13240 [Bacilli bacterium]|nr:hypothetical protein FACS1894166_13240 [Bacilli bacterium]